MPPPSADLGALRAFVAVARLGHVGRAADRLGRTQSSVSARLAALEEAWGARLFRRHARGMALTPEGGRLLPLAEAVLRAADDLDAAAGTGEPAGRDLRLGSGDALGRELLPRVLSRLLAEDPALEVRLLEGPAPRLQAALAGGEIDLALVAAPGPLPADLDAAPVLESPIDLLLPPGTVWPRRVAPDALDGQRLVLLQTGSGFRRHLESALAARGVRPVAAVEVGNLALVRRFVAAGLGIGPVPAVAFGEAPGRPAVVRRRLSGVPEVPYVRLMRAGAPLSRVTGRFLELLAREAARPARPQPAGRMQRSGSRRGRRKQGSDRI